MTLRIERSVRLGITVFALSGHMNAEQVAELKKLFDAECGLRAFASTSMKRTSPLRRIP
jgi:hypothetical protein